MSKPRYLRCACCGSYAGKFHQHWNQDDGFGICRKCVDWILSRGESEESIRFTYGMAGHNFEAKTFKLFDRVFNVLAIFKEDNAAEANAYMEKYDGACVLAIDNGNVIIADRDDKGVPA